jgi:hypothetical protein
MMHSVIGVGRTVWVTNATVVTMRAIVAAVRCLEELYRCVPGLLFGCIGISR